jgi:hypothetical protein
MPASRLYYQLKPYLPWRLRMAVRRIIARRQRKAHQDVWPINEAAGHPPAGWPGWPEGKKFALVLTHDVESPAGLAKCRQLMQLEMQMGFRSSFNFIPEGEYNVSREFREELLENGFEVGVQDLKHDGMLFQSREAFRHGANQINRYMHEWGAVGFRSGFMFHNLEWAHDLDIDYSSCTFDTDPFEPQPDDVGTIFPFCVPVPVVQKSEVTSQKSEIRNQRSVQPSAFSLQPSGAGYVELPYTLPQDSTLFLVLSEPTPEIWLRKLDWIVQHGGMALVNVHPDYLRFPGEPVSPQTFPVEFYEKLLQSAREKYSGSVWHALPKQIAAFCKATIQSQAAPSQTGQNRITTKPGTS